MYRILIGPLALLALLVIWCLIAFAAPASAETAFVPNPYKEGERYKGPFTTQTLYKMCSSRDHDKCDIYIRGLMYGMKIQTYMRAAETDMSTCLPEMTVEAARQNLLSYINMATGGDPGSNGDSGDWVAYTSLAAGHLCKK